MKRNKKTVILLLLLLSLFLHGCMQPKSGEEGTSDSDGEITPPTHFYENMNYQYLTDVDVSVLTTDFNPVYLLLMNKKQTLGEDFVPSSLTTLTCDTLEEGRKYELESRVAKALYAMMDEMRADNVKDIMVASAYRAYSYQVTVYNKHVNKEASGISADAYAVLGYDYIQQNYITQGLSKLNHTDAQRVAQSYSAKPGESEHQTGLCVDFITSTMGSELTVEFANTEAFVWLSENAYRFGFILRYPEGKESITGYTYEPWHYRFVGREAATDIYFGNLTLEEYLNAVSV